MPRERLSTSPPIRRTFHPSPSRQYWRDPILRGLLTLLAFSSFFTSRAYAQNLPPGFSQTVIADGMRLPTDLAFASDGRLFIAEKRGTIRALEPDGTLRVQPVISIDDEVNNAGDRGLLSIALDPNFLSNGYIYLLYTVDPVYGSPEESADEPSFGRLTRYTLTAASGRYLADPASRLILIGASSQEGFPSCYNTHTIGAVRFGLDGSLFVSAGDGASKDYVDYGQNATSMAHECEELFGAAQDIGALRAQSLDSLAGKVIRVNPANGQGLASNPFYTGNPADFRSRVWAYGFRQPYHFTVRPNSQSPGVLYLGDVGSSQWEELDVVLPGENHGWPCWEGNAPMYLYQEDVHTASTCAQVPPAVVKYPTIAYSHADPGTNGFTGNAAVGGVFYTGTQYPAPWRGQYFFSDYVGSWFRALPPTGLEIPNTDPQGISQFFADGLEAPVTLNVDPISGNLVYASIERGEIRMLSYLATQQPPVLSATVTPRFGAAPLPVLFNASASTDPEGEALSFLWTFSDGPTDTRPQFSRTFSQEGNYSVSLTVTDPTGRSASATYAISVGNTPPVGQIVSPTDGSTVVVPGNVQLEADGADSEDASLPDSAYTWVVDLMHDTHIHYDWFTATGQTASFRIEAHGEGDISYRIRLTVTDSGGLTDEDQVIIAPELGGIDRDQDGLSDTREQLLGTNPTDPDSDDDGLSDGEEVNGVGTNPLSADSDQDGLNDFAELHSYGTNPTDPDGDADGLTDGAEVNTHGTDPRTADTDGDGLDDGEEVLYYHTQPLQTDTDSDGLSDGEEVQTFGTDPLNPDSDGDGIPDGQEYQSGPPQVSTDHLEAFSRAGQTFITWPEDRDHVGERYHLYRASQPITSATLASAEPVAILSEGTGTFQNELNTGNPYQSRFIIRDLGPQLPENVGLFVNTSLSATPEQLWYAITIEVNGVEQPLLQHLSLPAGRGVWESKALARPVAVWTNGLKTLYTHWMDYASWNVAFEGYAYNFWVGMPAHAEGEVLPVQLNLHSWGESWQRNWYAGDGYGSGSPYGFHVLWIQPDDARNTWWYGFGHNVTRGQTPNRSSVIVNYTEQRLSWILQWITGPDSPYTVDAERMYINGASMGGMGALNFGLRHPEYFAGVYGLAALTNESTSGWARWAFDELFGPVSENLPTLSGQGIHDVLNAQQYIQTSVQTNTGMNNPESSSTAVSTGLETPFSMTFHGRYDGATEWNTQGLPWIQARNNASGPGISMWADSGPYDTLDIYTRNLFPNYDLDGWNLRRDEAYASFSHGQADDNPTGTIPSCRGSAPFAYGYQGAAYEWASSGHPFLNMSEPLDTAQDFEIALRIRSDLCGLPDADTVTVRLYRTQQFHPSPGATLPWTFYSPEGVLLQSGLLTVGEEGELTLEGLTLDKTGGFLALTTRGSPDSDQDGVTVADGDCDDGHADTYPGALEQCDGRDNDCDRTIDEGVQLTFYADEDRDGYGGSLSTQACTAPTGYVSPGGDCDDSDISIHPGAEETCDRVDEDCDGLIDDGLPTGLWYVDSDQDGYGGATQTAACGALPGYSPVTGDCNDAASAIHPGAPELCDGLDNDCDTGVDEALAVTWFRDQDGDGFGSNLTQQRCAAPTGFVARAGDCDDARTGVHPGQAEVCDGLDNDCDNRVDEALTCGNRGPESRRHRP